MSATRAIKVKPKREQAMTTWAVLVNNGYSFEYEATIEAKSVADARKIWKRRGDHMTVNFRVTKVCAAPDAKRECA